MVKLNKRTAIVLSFLSLNMAFNQTVFGAKDSTHTRLLTGRELFYESVQKSDKIDDAFDVFNEIARDERYNGIALTYLGALTALKGKYAFSPISKYRLVLKGLKMMDEGVSVRPDNMEARFIRGMTCYYLPFFFKRKDTAIDDFKVILKQLEQSYDQYDSSIVMNVTSFLLENLELSREEKESLKNIQKSIKIYEM